MTLGTSENKFSGHAEKEHRTLRMPSKYADMADDRMQYGGELLIAAKCGFISSAVFFLAGGVLWALNHFWDVGNKQVMNSFAITLAVCGTLSFSYGVLAQLGWIKTDPGGNRLYSPVE